MTTYTLSESVSSGTQAWGDIALRFSGSPGAGASLSVTGASSLTLTTTQDHSAVAVMVLDPLAANGSGRVWATVNGYTPSVANALELDYTLLSSNYTVYVAYYPDVGTAGPVTVGLTAPAGISGTVVAVEIKGTTTGKSLALPTARVTVTAPAPSIPAQGQPGLIQEISGSTTGSSLTLTLPHATTPHNAVIIAASGYYGGAISNITLGGTGNIFKKVATSSGYNAEIWADLNVVQSSNTIVITTTQPGIMAWAYEVAGAVPVYGNGSVNLDATAGGYFTSGTAYASGVTPSTLAGNEFVVGLGFSLNTTSGNTINAPTTGGWTNETAYNNIAAGSFFIGGVSGYQIQASSSSTYNYHGTTATNSSGSAVAASFLLMPAQTGWGGVVFQEHGSYTGISATFTIPTLTGEANALSSVWVGLGNVYQTGIFLSYDTTKTGNSNTTPWSWWIPGAGELWNATAYPTKAGDSLTLTIQLTSTAWLMTIANSTEGWTYTEVKSVLAVNVGSIQNNGAGPAFWPYPLTQAQIIIEKEGSSPNPNYGSLAFTSVTTTPAVSVAPFALATANASIDQYPGAFNIGAGSFTMHWNGYT